MDSREAGMHTKGLMQQHVTSSLSTKKFQIDQDQRLLVCSYTNPHARESCSSSTHAHWFEEISSYQDVKIFCCKSCLFVVCMIPLVRKIVAQESNTRGIVDIALNSQDCPSAE